jgi:hypothetical protein
VPVLELLDFWPAAPYLQEEFVGGGLLVDLLDLALDLVNAVR